MARTIVLGSACAVSDAQHEHSYLAVAGETSAVLIDCAGQALVRLRRAGLGVDSLSDVILTHFHPDHVYGLPVLLMELWLCGRQRPLRVHGLAPCLERMQQMLTAYGLPDWQPIYPISFQVVAPRAGEPVVETEDFSVFAWPVEHVVPTLGVRVVHKLSGGVMAYSSDTHPCLAVTALARGADWLIHEATGAYAWHSSAAQAGAAARLAGARRLALIHYPVGAADPRGLVGEAAGEFAGPVCLAEDFAELEF